MNVMQSVAILLACGALAGAGCSDEFATEPA